MKATAIANSNIALVKYWGKRDPDLILPHNSSISMTLDSLHTTTTVEFNDTLVNHQVRINGKTSFGEEFTRITDHLTLLQQPLKVKLFARIASKSNFPKKAGLASSASGFAALTLAGTAALGQKLESKELSILSRRGSGSASRSILGGFVEWQKGELTDGSDSYAISIQDESHWPELAMIVSIISTEEKKVSSRAGMSQTVETSPMYQAWLDTIEVDILNMKEAIVQKDFTQVGKIAEMNALKMHSTMHTTTPSIIYWESGSLALMKEVQNLRKKGTECYFTMDAGPQVKILCQQQNIDKIQKEISKIPHVKDTIVCKVGKGARLSNSHLF
ncbi:MAG: diphosphomevalonate decarboxylase [Candidatus Hodarchaeales archaeon]|jgi:diphosphomevalonate decarboxylase